MKKVIVLRALIALFILGIFLAMLPDFYVLLWVLPPHSTGGTFLVFISTSISLIKAALLLPCLILLFGAVHYFIKSGYFNSRSANKLKAAGILLMINSAIEYVASHVMAVYAVNTLNAQAEHPVNWLGGLTTLFVFILAGFGLYTLSEFIRKGEAIERENELTI